MKIGQVFLDTAGHSVERRYLKIIENLDKLAIEQYAVVSSPRIARTLQAFPFVSVSPIVKSAIMAYCLMPDVNVVHVHGRKGGQAGLLLALTRSIPFVIDQIDNWQETNNPITRSIVHRAFALIEPSISNSEDLVNLYRRAAVSLCRIPGKVSGW